MSILDSILSFAGRHPSLEGPLKELNRQAINHFATSIPPRPRALSLWSPNDDAVPGAPDYLEDYTSWPSLTDKTFSGRHLSAADPAYTASLPLDRDYPYRNPNPSTGDIGAVTQLFARPKEMAPSRSSLLFMFFAQWFTDSILRVDPKDRRKNKSNHDIDLCSIYGLTEATARLLRSHEGGRLQSQIINGEEYLDYLCDQATLQVKPRYAELEANKVGLDNLLRGFPAERRQKLYATGLERGNSSIGYVAISTIFMREHNRIAGELAQQNRTWGDERLFQTARNINIVILMKLVVEDYINHILGHHIFRLDHEFAEEQHWYRANWIALEFDLLYRWHSLAPDGIKVGQQMLAPGIFRSNNALLEQIGVAPLIDAVSRQPAGKVGLGNTPKYLWGAEFEAIKMSRNCRVRSYNDYRERFGLARKANFAELTSDEALAGKLQALYGDIEKLEFFVGLFAEEPDQGLIFGELLNRMVAYDAFTQIFSNPLLSKNVHNAATFTDYGLEQIEQTTSIEVLVNRNVAQRVRASLGVL